VALACAGLSGIAYGQDQPAINSPAIFKTIVPHVNSIPRPIHIGEPGPETEVAVLPGFTQPPFIVGPVVTPTTTAPEAEEEIASDPNNYQKLLAMISDFSQNGGFNTSKWAFSSNGGTSWKQAFVPRSGGFPHHGRQSHLASEQ